MWRYVYTNKNIHVVQMNDLTWNSENKIRIWLLHNLTLRNWSYYEEDVSAWNARKECNSKSLYIVLGRGPGEKKRQKRKNAESVERATRFGQDIVDYGDVVAAGPSSESQLPSGGCQSPRKRPTTIAKLHQKRVESTQNAKDVMKISDFELVNDNNQM